MLLYRHSNGVVDTVPLYIDGTERSCRTGILAGTASDTVLRIYGWNPRRVVVTGIYGHHLYGAYGAVSGAAATPRAMGENDAVFTDPYGVADLGSRLLCLVDWTDGP